MQTIRWIYTPTDRLHICSCRNAGINFPGSELFYFYIFPLMFSLEEELVKFYM
jgi:hypothetical protein